MRLCLFVLVFGLLSCAGTQEADAGLLGSLFGRRDVNVTVVNTGGDNGNANFRFANARFSNGHANDVNLRFLNVRKVNGFRLNSFQTRQFNSFGSRTFVDGHGNIFEVDRFGNAIFRGNARSSRFGGFGGRSLRFDDDD